MKNLAEWLQSTGCTQVSGGTVTIQSPRQTFTYAGARYKRVIEAPEGSLAAQEGRRLHVVEEIYCVGLLPARYWCQKFYLRVQGDGREWYVAGYWPAADWPRDIRQVEHAPYPPHHPHGPSFVLRPWPVAFGRIDGHEKTKPRLNLTFTPDDPLAVGFIEEGG